MVTHKTVVVVPLEKVGRVRSVRNPSTLIFLVVELEKLRLNVCWSNDQHILLQSW